MIGGEGGLLMLIRLSQQQGAALEAELPFDNLAAIAGEQLIITRCVFNAFAQRTVVLGSLH